jgi:5-methylcytosine-specific restriction endonuclease McrA
VTKLTSRQKREIVRARDGDYCWYEYCEVGDEPIDFSLDPDDPLSPSLDHTIPRAAGGSNGVKNMRVMHRICNHKKAAVYDGVNYEHTPSVGQVA